MIRQGLSAVLNKAGKTVYIRPIGHNYIKEDSHWGDQFIYSNGFKIGLFHIPAYNEIGHRAIVERVNKKGNTLTEKEFLDGLKNDCIHEGYNKTDRFVQLNNFKIR